MRGGHDHGHGDHDRGDADHEDHDAERGGTCVFGEPQHQARLVKAVSKGRGVRVVSLYPLGSHLAPGAAHYPVMPRNMAQTMEICLGGQG